MQTQQQQILTTDTLRNKFANLTVKEIQLNLDNQKGILNRNNRHYKMLPPRRQLAPIIRKELGSILRHGQPNDIQMKLQTINFDKKRIHKQSQEKKKNNNGKIAGKNTFILNSLIEILQTNQSSQTQNCKHTKRVSMPRKVNIQTQPSQPFNEFSYFNCTTTKNKRGPKILQNQITRLGNHNNIIRRKLYSQEKSRIHCGNIDNLRDKNQDNFQQIQILTFYKQGSKINQKDEDADNEFISQQKL